MRFSRADVRSLALGTAEVWKRTAVLGNHDADTVTVDVDTGVRVDRRDALLADVGALRLTVLHRHLHLVGPVRLFGLNAPELQTPEGKTAQKALAKLLPVGTGVTLTMWTDKGDKYGRLLGALELKHLDVNRWLVDQGYAAVWDGLGPKPVPGGGG